MEGGIRQTYYEILGVAVDSSAEQIRRAYHKLAKIWHPDRWTKDPFRSGEAKRRFQQIQEAYSGKDLFRLCFEVFWFLSDDWHCCLETIFLCLVLSDERKRSSYDVGLYDSGEDEVCMVTSNCDCFQIFIICFCLLQKADMFVFCSLQ